LGPQKRTFGDNQSKFLKAIMSPTVSEHGRNSKY